MKNLINIVGCGLIVTTPLTIALAFVLAAHSNLGSLVFPLAVLLCAAHFVLCAFAIVLLWLLRNENYR